MKYFTLCLFLVLMSCIKVGTHDLSLHELDQSVAVKQEVRQRAGYWEAMQNLDFYDSSTYADSSEERQFSAALQLMLSGDYDSAETRLEHLVETSSDSLFLKHAGSLLSGIYMLSYNWEDMIKLDHLLPGGLDDMNSISMVKAWATQPPEKIHYRLEPLIVPSKKSIAGTPKISVWVNGVEQTFWIDTGAQFTVLSSDIAEICNVKPLVEKTSTVGTATDKNIELWPGMIKELKIGDLVFENHPVFIIDQEDLEFRILKIIKILKIDGILGWNAIQKLRLEINNVENSIGIQKPEKRDWGMRNFHYLTQPFVTVQDTMGVPLEFFLDTGANKTSLYAPALAYFDTTHAQRSTAFVGGAGGSQKVKQLQLAKQSLVFGKTRIDFPEIQGASPLGDSEDDFMLFDGIIGSDIASNAILTLDFQNGWCELKRVAE
ncbi:MAG: retroviral-like aspartic protease family protein [Candidatus Marinimicrobia bacterium]|nr:retroviral-like aspartic protease family protein [Candidatus Neomarinimicrobiota bacterium]